MKQIKGTYIEKEEENNDTSQKENTQTTPDYVKEVMIKHKEVMEALK